MLKRILRRYCVERVPHLKEDGDSRDLLGVCLVAVAEVTPMGQVQGHDPLMGLQKRCVHLQAYYCQYYTITAAAAPFTVAV